MTGTATRTFEDSEQRKTNRNKTQNLKCGAKNRVAWPSEFFRPKSAVLGLLTQAPGLDYIAVIASK